ncbi:MAG: hypothetical protein RMA76_34435 [Deltaproteobacteria bacterium]|jgi:alpha-tubulin suppressor-like RCC1 family protein
MKRSFLFAMFVGAAGCSTEALELEAPAANDAPSFELADATPTLDVPAHPPVGAPPVGTPIEPPVAPVDVPPVVAVGLGRRHSCAVTKLGELFCWGSGARGQTGHGDEETIGDDELPAQRSRVDLGHHFVIDVAAGHHHTCALTGAGEVLCFGVGAYGQLGLASTDDVGATSAPDTVTAIGGSAAQIVAGELHTCVLLDDGHVRCFGAGDDGRLGYGDAQHVGDDEAPHVRDFVDLGLNVVALAAGDAHTCALSVEGTVRCWGENDDGRLGYGMVGDIGDDESPKDAGLVPLPGLAVQISAGTSHTCAVLEDGGVACFGKNRYGELGTDSAETIGDDAHDTIVRVDLDLPVAEVSAGNFRTCVRFETGGVRCWGYPFDGGLGVGSMTYAPSPRAAEDVGLGMDAFSIASGGDHSCAIVEGRHLRCWGQGEGGRLGYGSEDNVGDDELPMVMGDVALFD